MIALPFAARLAWRESRSPRRMALLVAAVSAGAADYVAVPGASLRSVLPPDGQSAPANVAAFRLRTLPVTNGEFLAFVRAHPEWRRDRVAKVFADRSYLRHWARADALGAAARAAQPVTYVSWFAANAYCKSENARLPSWHEWELSAAADASRARWKAGRALGGIDGAPFAVKDCYDVAGFATRVNSGLFADAAPARADAAHVDALRRGGGVFLGKTVTTELTMAEPGPTWNPWDLRRTPGGSSSGSAAAVAACMVPLASGGQVRGSGIRPASICGVSALKPTFGALNRHGGFDPSPSLNHLVLFGASFEDIWDAAVWIAADVGGDPGHKRFVGAAEAPTPRKPRRLARQYTYGWPLTDPASQAAFETALSALAQDGVEILEPDALPELRAYEDATAKVPEFFFDLMLWEIRAPMRAYLEGRGGGLSATMRGHVEKAAAMSAAQYDAALRRQEELRALHRALAGVVEGFITLAHIGPGQIGQPKLGTPWYNDASSAVGAPSVNLPILTVEAAPLGVQLMGFEGADSDLVAQARWFMRRL